MTTTAQASWNDVNAYDYELGDGCTTAQAEAYNAIQRRELAKRFGDDYLNSEIESYIEDHWLRWLQEAISA